MYREQYQRDICMEKTIFILGRQIDTHKITHGLTANPYDEFVFHPKEHWKKISTK